MTQYKGGYFVGSLSSKSINRLLAKALARLAPPELVLTEIPIKDLPLYSPDFDADYPPVARALKQSIVRRTKAWSRPASSSQRAVKRSNAARSAERLGRSNDRSQRRGGKAACGRSETVKVKHELTRAAKSNLD